MSEREIAVHLLDTVPNDKIAYVIGYIQGLTTQTQEKIDDEVPNADTLEAFAEVDKMKLTGAGEHFSGTTEELFSMILEG